MSDTPQERGAAEYRNTVLPEQLFITTRPFAKPVSAEQLHAVLRSLTEHTIAAAREMDPSVQADPLDARSGIGQAEVRAFLSGPKMQAAFLQRGDAGRCVSVSIYRYLPRSKMDLSEYANAVFDLAQFEPTPV